MTENPAINFSLSQELKEIQLKTKAMLDFPCVMLTNQWGSLCGKQKVNLALWSVLKFMDICTVCLKHYVYNR